MSLSSEPPKIVLPFANSGTKNTIPVASQIGITDGAASLTDGFPPLTLTPKSAGGVPPFGQDMNGILYAVSAIARWASAGAGYVYDAEFAADANVSGYPKGARILRTDGAGYWINTISGNTSDPEAGGAGWYPDFTVGAAAVAMTDSNVTLTPLQYGKPVIIISGALTANLQLIFPAIVAKWAVINNTTGAYSITCKTSAGTGVVVRGTQNIVGDGTNIRSTTPLADGTESHTENTKLHTTASLRAALNASGAAPIYAVRAYADFNGGAAVLNAAYNVASLIDLGVGKWGVTFSTAMPTATYGVAPSCRATNSSGGGATVVMMSGSNYRSTSSCDIWTLFVSSGSEGFTDADISVSFIGG